MKDLMPSCRSGGICHSVFVDEAAVKGAGRGDARLLSHISDVFHLYFTKEMRCFCLILMKFILMNLAHLVPSLTCF